MFRRCWLSRPSCRTRQSVLFYKYTLIDISACVCRESITHSCAKLVSRESLGDPRASKRRIVVAEICSTDRQDAPYNPSQQGQVGQLSNRYIVISRLIRYERSFFSPSYFMQRLCHDFAQNRPETRSVLSNHASLCFRVPENHAVLLRHATFANHALRVHFSKTEADYRNATCHNTSPFYVIYIAKKSLIDIGAMIGKSAQVHKDSISRKVL